MALGEGLVQQHAAGRQQRDRLVQARPPQIVGDDDRIEAQARQRPGRALGRLQIGLERAARLPGRVVEDADACLVAEVQAAAAALDAVDDAQALLIVPEADAGVDRVERALSRVAERRVAEVVPEADGLGEVLIEFERAGDRAREARDLERVCQARAVMVALRAQEHLRLVLQAAERFRVRDAVHVALEACAHLTRRLGRQAAG